jgi:hypothetical protein
MSSFFLLKFLDLADKNLTSFNSDTYFNVKDSPNSIDSTDSKNSYNDDTYHISLKNNKFKDLKINNFLKLKQLTLSTNNDLESIEIINCPELIVLDISYCKKLNKIDGLEENTVETIICQDTNVDFLEEKYDSNIGFQKNNNDINYIIDNIYLGNSSHTEDELRTIGISYIFNITNNHYREYNRIIELKYPTEDIYTQNIMESFPDIVKKMKELNDEGLNIYIHCHAGISRSSSIIILYLMTYHNYNYEDAFKFVRNKRICIQPNRSFIEQLKVLEKKN